METVGPVRGLPGDRNRYRLTETGRQRALERYREATANARELGHAALECWVRLRAAESLTAVGDPGAANEHLEAVLATCEGTGPTPFEGAARDQLERSRDVQ